MGPKYEFTDETKIVFDNILLHRIIRLSDGRLGGFIEKEENLSQEGNCWIDDKACIFENAQVYGNARVYDDACIRGNAKVFDNAHIFGNAVVCDNAKVFDHAKIYDDAVVYNKACIAMNAEVYGKAKVFGTAEVWGDNVKVYGHATITDKSIIHENAQVYDYAVVSGAAAVFGDAQIYGNAKVYDNAKVHGNTKVYGNVEVSGSTEIYDNTHISGDTKANNNIKNNVVKDFIYKIDNSQKFKVQTEYESINEFFNEPAGDDLKLDTLVVCTIDTKEPIIKLQKVDSDGNVNFKFIVEITNSKGEEFIIRSFIESQEQLDKLIKQTVEALTIYPQFNIYADELEEIIS